MRPDLLAKALTPSRGRYDPWRTRQGQAAGAEQEAGGELRLPVGFCSFPSALNQHVTLCCDLRAAMEYPSPSQYHVFHLISQEFYLRVKHNLYQSEVKL